MTYSSGLRNRLVKVAKRAAQSEMGAFGKNGIQRYEWLNPNGDHAYWMGETFNRGAKSMRVGAFDAYDVVMFRCRRIKGLDRWCLLQYKGRWYQIESFNEDDLKNKIQITAKEMSNQQVKIVEPYSPSTSAISGGSSQTHEVG